MATKHDPHDKLAEDNGVADPGYEAWKEAHILAAIAEADDPSNLIPADRVWRELGLED